ncbi:hypothetical protein [Colwellia sp. TT2012]|uniref:hypothetical protein n=1 Tax=Colwellia sp. TT2012 TaxID=1720342 RepID=UPI00070C5FDF|nr:hypothetical protein [Colwellia sp. TT2012]
MDDESIKAKLEFDQISINQKNIDEFNKLKPSDLGIIYIVVTFFLIMLIPIIFSIEINSFSTFSTFTAMGFMFCLIIYGQNRDTNRRIDLLLEIIKKQSKNT